MEQIRYLHIFIRPGGTYLANSYLVAQLIFSQTNEDDLWEQCCIPTTWNLPTQSSVKFAKKNFCSSGTTA